jgi:hypothetical protein
MRRRAALRSRVSIGFSRSERCKNGPKTDAFRQYEYLGRLSWRPLSFHHVRRRLFKQPARLYPRWFVISILVDQLKATL